jgi:aspartate-semialdehyde dehydrogenase
MISRKTPPFRVAIVGASTLKGKEVKSALLDRKFPVRKLALLDSDEDLGRLSEFDGEPAFSMTINEGSFELLDVAFFAGSPETTRTYAHLAKGRDFLSVDLTHAFLHEPAVPLFMQTARTKTEKIVPHESIISSPHPAAITVAKVLEPLSRCYEIKNCVVSILEPASERGSNGVEELKQQTIDLFSFHKGSQGVFDRQLAFNLLSRFGAEAKEKLLDVEHVIATHLKALLPSFPLPSVTLIQAPVFHSHAFSFFLDVESSVTIADLEKCLQSEFLTVIETEDEPPSPVQVAGSDFIQIGGMKRDFLRPSGLWFWVVSDNLRLAALNAVSAAETFLRSERQSE